jgi:hypothetical protein
MIVLGIRNVQIEWAYFSNTTIIIEPKVPLDHFEAVHEDAAGTFLFMR